MTTVIQFPEREVEPLADRVTEEIKALMGRYTVSQTKLADWLELNQTAVSARLRGRTKWTLEDLDRIAERFNVHPAELLGGYASGPRPGPGPDGGQAAPEGTPVTHQYPRTTLRVIPAARIHGKPRPVATPNAA